jgi:hypothetical protein
MRFIEFQKESVKRGEISGSTIQIILKQRSYSVK